ncbi:MAG TPA: cytochrome c3 family protein [Candidatus Hydrogenedentes bacterium]|nr:cytochrome c3 family protein [Candidatus Hydrogenedentota bacterium]HRT66728.1 cytochrome c3 family protein [Candidatus Hydrogenedentota bacterium]
MRNKAETMGHPAVSKSASMCLVFVAMAAVVLVARSLSAEMHAKPGNDCSPCHTCEKPTKEDPCLKKCLRPEMKDADKRFAESQSAPDVILIDKMSELYMPVVFPHRLHAAMEAMSDGCEICHHHEEATAEKPQPCSACHGDFTQPGNLWKPGLRGAYHRQCLSCHRDWSGSTDCIKCHEEREPGQPIEPKPDLSDTTGKLHPNVAEPDKLIYRTPGLEEGMLVTFNHKEHVQVFGKRCVNCHRQENCNRCHNRNGDAPKHVRDDPHQDCAGCHAVDGDCSQCHMKTESPGFNHEKRTGFELKSYHKGVACKACHKDPATYKGLRRECSACHAADWSPPNFDHAKSGKITLDENHAGTDCAGCHPNGMGAPINCEACHEKTFVYPQKSPGAPVGAPAPEQPPSPPQS